MATAPHIVAMVRRRPPNGAPVVPGSTPVVAFGDPSRAEVATLGINPSAREFAENGKLLSGSRRRLATLQSLGATSLAELTDEQVSSVVADCARYFDRRPYRRWFGPLDDLLRHATGTSYYRRSACHLDLVQWATDPTWGRIPDADIKRELLDDGVPHLRALLAHGNFRLILLNGREVLDQVRSLQLADLEEVRRVPKGQGECRLCSGVGSGIRWVGWSTNLQSSWGVSRTFKEELAEWLRGMSAADSSERVDGRADAGMELDADGHLPYGLRVGGKGELLEVLRRWLIESEAATIGDVGSFGGRAWLFVDVRGEEVVLNADTKRAAVMSFRMSRALHRPYWYEPTTSSYRQNTDPWVFGETMLYSNCKQLVRAKRRPTSMQALERGSVIFLGSTISGEFCLDTVFVVASCEQWIPAEAASMSVDEAFRTCTARSVATGEDELYATFTLYRRATIERSR